MLESTSSRNAAVNARTALVNSGSVKIYTSGDVLLVSCALASTAFGSASTGVATAATISDGTAVATGTASYATLCNSGGTEIIRLTVGTSGSDLNLTSTSISTGDTIRITSGTLTQPAS